MSKVELFYFVFLRRNENIFHNDNDLAEFKNILKKISVGVGIDVIAYCILKKEFGIIIRLDSEHYLQSFIQKILLCYSHYFKKVHGEYNGFLKRAYKSQKLNKEELIEYCLYLHNLPKSIVYSDEEYKYTSFNEYFNGEAGIANTNILEIKKETFYILHYYAWNVPRKSIIKSYELDFKGINDLLKRNKFIQKLYYKKCCTINEINKITNVSKPHIYRILKNGIDT